MNAKFYHILRCVFRILEYLYVSCTIKTVMLGLNTLNVHVVKWKTSLFLSSNEKGWISNAQSVRHERFVSSEYISFLDHIEIDIVAIFIYIPVL